MRRRMMVEKIVAILAAGGQMGVWDTALVYILHPVAFYDHPTTINATFATSVAVSYTHLTLPTKRIV